MSKGVLQLVLASLCFGFIGIFGKMAFAHGVSVGAFLTYRFVLASFILFLCALVFRPTLFRASLSQIFIAAILGFFGYAVFSTLYFMAVKGVSVALAAMLLYTYPFWVSLLGHVFLKERMNRLQWFCLALASLGLVMLLWGSFTVHSSIALLAGLGSALTYAIYILASARWQKNIHPLTSSLYVIPAAAVGLYIYHHPSLQAALHLPATATLSVIGVAVIGTILPLTLVLAGLQKMKSSQAALITMIEPLTAAAMAWVIFGDTLSTRQLIGGAMILIALVLRLRS